MDCDHVIFTRDALDNLKSQPIVSISQRHCGYQSLPEELVGSGLTLRELDLSDNSIYRLMDRQLQAQTQLRVLRLANNLLGDNLNPIFSSNEFHGMEELRKLDLRKNGLRNIEEGIFKGCINLEELYLDENNMTTVPTASLKGPKGIKILSLIGNNIGSLSRGAFLTLGESLIRLDLSNNGLSHMEDGSLSGLERLLFLNISRNDLTRFNSDVFKGAYNLLQLDLSVNFLQEFPTYALRHLTDLKFLNISNNLITKIERVHLLGLTELQVLDLSRNNIGRLGINTFSSLSSLTRLDLSLNALRTIEESSFEGLVKLKWLSLQDNNILLVPATALTRLPALAHLHVEFNRVAALSAELIRSTSSSLVTLGLTRNLVREIPGRLFYNFENLISIELSGNMLSAISQNTFAGLEDTLLNLDVSYNRLSVINELPLRNLLSLNLAGNQLKRISPETLKQLPRLQYLNLSSNALYGGFPPIFPSSLYILDISYTGLKILPTVLMLNLESLEKIYLSGNHLQEIDEGTFQHQYNLSVIDLSNNFIEHIDNGAFVGLINLYELNLRGNRLTSFIGEYFNTGTGLQILDLSNNRLSQLSPTAFVIHPRLRSLDLSNNDFVHFPSDFIKSLQFLERLDLSRNELKNVGEFSFSQIGRLHTLNLSGNKIESVEELAFHNSTQLQVLDLSNNILETLSERTMEGLLRLQHLDLQNNKLASLPETIFDQSRIRSVESIDLSGNYFNEIPIRTLQRQSASLLSLKIARNKMTEVFTQDIVNNVKELDLSENPLSENAVRGILGEAKILRSLNLAQTGIKFLTRLETPFLKHLNLSGNDIIDIKPAVLERTTMLESLDISRNKLTDFSNLVNTFKILPTLQTLKISNNDVKAINESSFDGLSTLRSLKIANLPNCTRIEKNAFKHLGKLRSLYAYNYPKLGYFDVQGILKGMPNLETVDIEIKDSSVGNEQLSIRTHPRLQLLTLRGERLRTVLSSSLVGVRVPTLSLGLKNTSVDTIPAALFFPVPRSTVVSLDITGNKFTTLPVQLLAALDERSGSVKLTGLDSNPINCNCETKHLWRWLKGLADKSPNVVCMTPDYVSGMLLNNLTEEYLTCDRTTLSRYQTTEITPSSRSTTAEPEIIWTVQPTTQNNRNKNYNGDHTSSVSVGNVSSTDDTLIIGIVGGVVAFIAIIVIVICICRLKWSTQMNEARMTAVASSIHEASMIRPASAYSGKINHDAYVGSYNGSTLGRGNGVHGSSVPTTPVQMMPYVQPVHVMHPFVPPPQVQGYIQEEVYNMTETEVEGITWCYWVLSVGTLFTFLGLVVACICSCRRNQTKNDLPGLCGMVTINHSDNDNFTTLPSIEVSQVPPSQDTIDNGKRTSGANRSLPDIPKDRNRVEVNTESITQDIYETSEVNSELYATVQDTEEQQSEREKTQGLSRQVSLVQENSTFQLSRFTPSTSKNGNNIYNTNMETNLSLQLSTLNGNFISALDEHPYAQLQSIPKSEIDQSHRKNSTQAIIVDKPSTSSNHANGNPVAPPRTRKSSSYNSLLSAENPNDIQAANAISGGVQANQDLPYMTPPLAMLHLHPPQPSQPSTLQHFSGDSQDSKGYTSISVREPLANILAQTKASYHQQHQPTRLPIDPHYATVSDDSDEMYAAIDEQEKIYTSGSETYAQIQPTVLEANRIIHSDPNPFIQQSSSLRTEEAHTAPQPPSVDSLRHVAHAHSRQASSSSANSSIINPGSPKPEKRQANSPLPPPPEAILDAYAAVDKRAKNDERARPNLSTGKSLEDMYAKVMKKKRDAEEQNDIPGSSNILHSEVIPSNRKLSLIEISRASWSSHDSVEIQKEEHDTVHYTIPANTTVNIHPEMENNCLKLSPIPDGDTNLLNQEINYSYESVNTKRNLTARSFPACDSNYEIPHLQSLRTNDYQSTSTSVHDGPDLLLTYPTPFKHRQVSNASSEDPGYEKVRLRRRIDLDQDTDSEPNYESMPHDSGEPNYASVCRPGDSDTDPNYESVSHGDPNYESVRYISVAASEEPPYEQVNSYKPETNIDGYEKIKDNNSIFNSDYEKINPSNALEQCSNGDTDDEQYVQHEAFAGEVT
ncbi:hypothetical protein M0802_001952 [Mischocyttarus mexicanus]|nr:hypothetical protein M0802_001952 [Mischocyttarus mexicanus]